MAPSRTRAAPRGARHEDPSSTSGQARTPAVAVVIVNWNGRADTLACLASLERLRGARPRWVLVVDNGSTDGSVAALRAYEAALGARPRAPFALELLEAGRNLGFAGGNNLGLRRALALGASHVWLLNNDTLAEPDALAELVARMDARPGVGLCGSTLVDAAPPHRVQSVGGARYDRWWGTVHPLGAGMTLEEARDLPGAPGRLDYVVAASMLVSRAFLDAVGPLSEDYFLYFEEIDWAERARGRFALDAAPASVVLHKEGASTGGNDRARAERSDLADYYAVRNRLRFTRRHAPYALPTVWLGLLPTALNRLRRRRWRQLGNVLRLATGGRSARLDARGEQRP